MATPTRAVTGFTLIELMVAIAILAILLALAVPSVQEMIKNNRVTAQHNELVALLNYAKSEAVRRNESIEVELTTTSDGWQGEVKDPAGEGADPCVAQGALRCASNQNVVLNQDLTLTFNERGYLDPFGPVQLTLQHQNCSSARQGRTIQILGTGQVNSSELDCSS